MSKNLSSPPAVSSNPVSTITVTDISDSMPMCHEDIPQLDINDLLEEPQADEETAPTNCVKSDIFDSLEAIYQNIIGLLDRIILQMAQMEVTS